MSNKGLTANVALTPTGDAVTSITELASAIKVTGVPRASINWSYPSASAYLDEDPKNRHDYESFMLADAVALLLAKAVASGVTASESDAKEFAKALGDWDTVFTGENLFFYVDWVREFSDQVSGSESSELDFVKLVISGAPVSDVIAKLMSKISDDSIVVGDASSLSAGLYKTESVLTLENALLLANLGKQDGVSALDAWNRVVSFVRLYADQISTPEDVGKLIEKPLEAFATVIENVIVGLLYEKTYNEVVHMVVRGDTLNDGLLGQYEINASIGGEFIYLLLQKPLSSSISTPADLFDRVVQWYPAYESAVSMADLGDGDGLVYSAHKVLADAPSPDDEYDHAIGFVRGYSDTSAAGDTSCTAVLSATRTIPGTLNNSLFNNLAFNASSSVTFVTNYTLL